jgi:drug/metabolite transporter (DMT)-like permease
LWSHWKRYAVLALLGVGCYNSFQYLALHTSTPINVTLVGSSSPVFMLGVGALFFKQTIRKRQILGAVLSIFGVLLVLSRGDWQALMNVQLVVGDVFVLMATAAWAGYSWLLMQTTEPTEVRNDWANFLMAQITLGFVWSGLFTAGEWAITDAHILWGWPLAAALAYVAIGPAILAYRCWGLGVQQAGPNIAGFFSNLTPLFAALLSALILGELPAWYHMAAFACIVGGIVVSSRR